MPAKKAPVAPAKKIVAKTAAKAKIETLKPVKKAATKAAKVPVAKVEIAPVEIVATKTPARKTPIAKRSKPIPASEITPDKYIIIKGARMHNLKNIDINLPRHKLIVITGLSGSGKSSLAFDTIYAEGQRRYVESLSAYARQFLGQMDKPDVDFIEGLSPAVSIDQKTASRNPR